MGSSSSKFRKHLQNGDEYAAIQLFNSSSDLRKGVDPNSSYGDTYNHDTPMHLAARHAMKSLLRIFLYELGGNPNKKNARNETSLHNVCVSPANCESSGLQQRRYECLGLLLQWRGAKLHDGDTEKVDMAAMDEKQNTALHYAAASGLRRCVELLVSQNAPLFMENEQKQTPCDCAEKCGQSEIALYLESKMVFSTEDEDEDETDLLLDQIEADEAYSGLRAQDLQEAKDQLLVETSDMLRVPLFTAEALLRNHEWSREMLLEAWMSDAATCCEKCGVVPPASLYSENNCTVAPPVPSTSQDHDLMSPTQTMPASDDTICDICATQIPVSEEPVPISCDHQFCRACWERYLTGKIKEGEAHNITCPAYDCAKLVPVEIIETLVSRDMARRYLQFDIKAFVDSNPNIKWCPYPGCGRAVKLPDSENPLSPTFRDPMGMNAGSDFSHAVDCGNGHIFCWECLGEAHEPASCEHWTQWHQKIAEIKPEELSGTDEESETSANCLWLITNSKPCPNCKSPIQKNEGCNHMKCSKCKHDFCWVCLEPWKKHSSATGGYFRCNRYEVVRKVEENNDRVKTDAEIRNKKMQELNKFIHYYTRFKNHENSFKLEEPLQNTAKEKMMVLARAVTDQDSANSETKFVEDAVQQLLKARRVLKCCYVYGYYLEETGYKKPIFEFMQTELEECTETLSEMVARPYLRTPRHKIIQTAHLVQRKRHEFVTAISKGLVPADTSPTLRKKRKKYSVELDDDIKKALLASIQDLNPSNTWVKDPSGRHTNLSAVLDWPEESDESDSENTPTHSISAGGDRPAEETSSVSLGNVALSETSEEAPSSTGVALCIRSGCDKPRAQNPRTGVFHDHCSIKCMRLDQTDRQDAPEDSPGDYFNDYELELLRALEMSRLQFLREMGQLRPGTGDSSRSPRTPGRSPMGRSPGGRSPGGRSPGGRSPGGRSPGAHSPGPEVSSYINLTDDIPPSPPIVLQDPPRGRGQREQITEGTTLKTSKRPEFESDLQRALELSRRTYQDEERDLRMAIEMSLNERSPVESIEGGEERQGGSVGDQSQPYCEEYSTIVTRVPNKSVEDLHLEVSHDTERTNQEILGACGGQGDAANQERAALSHDTENTEIDPNHVPNSFGLIKDISVNNICASDLDKTKDFEKKDFSQIYLKCQPMSEMEKVFEPRPGGHDYQSLARKLQLTPTDTTSDSVPATRGQDVSATRGHSLPVTRGQDIPVTRGHCVPVTRGQDVWVEQTPANSRTASYGGPPRSPRDTQPYCPLSCRGTRDQQPYCPLGSVSRSPKDTCPLASPFSRSPRETCPLASVSRSPRDRRSYSGYESETLGRAGPDLLRVLPPRRCTSMGDTSWADSSANKAPYEELSSHDTSWADSSANKAPYEELSSHEYSLDAGCLDSGFDTNIFDDDDPGPQLDAVLRSLSKLTARLGDDDEFFPNYSEDPPLPPPPPPPPTHSLSSHQGSTTRSESERHHAEASAAQNDGTEEGEDAVFV